MASANERRIEAVTRELADEDKYKVLITVLGGAARVVSTIVLIIETFSGLGWMALQALAGQSLVVPPNLRETLEDFLDELFEGLQEETEASEEEHVSPGKPALGAFGRRRTLRRATAGTRARGRRTTVHRRRRR
jgi:hypothetical protein